MEMNLTAMLLSEHSKANTTRIVDYIGADAKRFAALVELLCGDDYRTCQRAAWPLAYVIEAQPDMLLPHLETLLHLLGDKKRHAAVRRNITRLLQDVEVPSEFQGLVVDYCFDLLLDFNEPVAVKAFAMTVLERNTRGIPELREELKLVIENQWEHEKSAFRGRGKEVLKLLKK
jgi:hypothetical protein